jgi:hypothetical protein
MRALPVRREPLWRTDFRQRIALSLWFLSTIFAAAAIAAANLTIWLDSRVDASASDSGKPARLRQPDNKRTIGAQHAMSHACRFRTPYAIPIPKTASPASAGSCPACPRRRSGTPTRQPTPPAVAPSRIGLAITSLMVIRDGREGAVSVGLGARFG